MGNNVLLAVGVVFAIFYMCSDIFADGFLLFVENGREHMYFLLISMFSLLFRCGFFRNCMNCYKKKLCAHSYLTVLDMF